jgi:hypothetical protein
MPETQEDRHARSRIIQAMPARELAEQLTPDVSQDIPPPQAQEAAGSEISTQGELPAVENGAIAEPGATASEQAFEHQPQADSGQLDGGVYHPDEYKAACEASGTPDKWDEKYRRGHTSANQWVQPYDGRYDNNFELKKGMSASQAVRDWLKGPTIADYRTIGVAMELDEVRDDLGDQKFDLLFGSSNSEQDGQIPVAQRLKITAGMYTIPFADQMKKLAAEKDAPVERPEEPPAPAVEARVEEKPTQAAQTVEPAPAQVAEELGMQQRDREFA